jgi:Na+-driven multidrug efflux pump
MPGLVVNLVGIALTVLLNDAFIHGVGEWQGMGFVGSAVASALTAWVSLGLYCLYTFVWKRHHAATWPGWTLQFLSWRRSKEFVVVQAIPAIVATALEEFQIEASIEREGESFVCMEVGWEKK